MIAREQNLRNRAAFPLPWLRILRIFEKTRLETLAGEALRGAQDAREVAHPGFNENHGGHLRASEHVVADRDFAQTFFVDDALVDPLKTAGEQRHAGARGEIANEMLRQ